MDNLSSADITEKFYREIDAILEDTQYHTEKLIGKDGRLYDSGAFCPGCGDEMRKTVKTHTKSGEVHDVFFCFKCFRYHRWIPNGE